MSHNFLHRKLELKEGKEMVQIFLNVFKAIMQ